MRSGIVRSTLVLVLLAAGLAASGALFVDYSAAVPVFCAEGGGCDALRHTALARAFGVLLPIAGMGGFVVLAVLARARGQRVRQVNVGVSALGALVGLILLALQLMLGHLCPYCAAVDTSAVLLGILGIDRLRLGWDPPAGVTASLGSAVLLTTALAAPMAWGHYRANRLPDVIAQELAATPRGEITIVDFVDFECPFCRQMQATLAPEVAAHKAKVRLVRRLVPLTRIHPHALDAARAACCAEALGKGDAMADALFQTEVDDLTPDGCARLAESLGLPLDAYRACLASPDTEARLTRDRREFDQAAVKGDGLPLMWVGRHKMMGAQDPASLSRVLDEALAGAGS